MTPREKFIAAIEDGKVVNSLAFGGWLCGFNKSDAAWLARQVKAGKIIKAIGSSPFYRPEYFAA